MKYHKIMLLVIVTLSSCAQYYGSLEQKTYLRIEKLDTDKVYAEFLSEKDSLKFKGHLMTNTTIVLGKRGIEAVNLIERDGLKGRPYPYHELFVNLAVYSKINICDLPSFLNLQYQADKKLPGFKFNCDVYQRAKLGRVESISGMTKPFFVR